MKKNTVYEDKAAKEAARKEKRQERLNKHIVKCPHCGKDVLDHMTKCPSCGKELMPAGYTPMSDEKRKKIRLITYSVGFAVAALIVVLILVL